MNKEQIKKFVELVDSGAPLKSYNRELGLNYHEYKYQLTRLHYYRSLLIEEDAPAPAPVVLPASKPEPEEAPVVEEEVFESEEEVEERPTKRAPRLTGRKEKDEDKPK